MEFSSYPFDWQVCPLEMESFAYTKSEIDFEWDQKLPPVEIQPGIRLPDYRLQGYLLEDCSKTYNTGNFTCISGT